MKSLPPVEYVKRLFYYNPETGVFTHRARTPDMFAELSKRRNKQASCNWFNTRFAGKPAGVIDARGYVNLKIDYVIYRAHRIAWLYSTGMEPAEEIDHINGEKSDNRIANLREASRQQNACNRESVIGLKFKGVCFERSRGKYLASICSKGKKFNLGRFNTPEDAAIAYANAAERLHGEYRRI